MNIIQAIKSGKPFKRPKMECWYSDLEQPLDFYREDIMADDWEIKSDVENFLSAFQNLMSVMEREFMEKPTHILISDSLKNKLIYHIVSSSRPIPDQPYVRGIQFLSYQHGNDMIKFVTTKEEIG